MNHCRTIGENVFLAWLVLTRVANWPRVVLDLLGLSHVLPRTYVMALRDGSSFRVRTASEDAKEVIVVSMTHEYPVDILAALPATAVIVDAGAHIGAFAVRARQLNPQARLFAIEPASANFELLQGNLMRNNPGIGTVVERCALSNFDGETTLSVAGPPDSWTIVGQSLSDDEKETVRCSSLCSLMDKHSISQIAFLKLDTEGSEHSILDESFATVAARVERIAVEYHPQRPCDSKKQARQQIYDRLTMHGYEVRDHNDHTLFAARINKE